MTADAPLLAYDDSADRVPVLWIHGYPLSSLLWGIQSVELADIARQIAPDLRGHGRTAPTPPPCTVAQYADDCIRVLDHAGVTGPVVVGGLSMGGYVALEIGRRHPERVAGLILAATRAGADSAEGRAGRDQAAQTARTDGVAAVVEGMLPKLFAPANLEAQPELVDFVRAMMLETTLDGMVGALAAMRDRPDSVDDLPGFDVPALVIHGAEDRLIPVAEAELTASRLPDAQLVVIPGAGHLPNLEQPEAFNAAVRTFLESFYEDDEQ
ncbi:MAG TPA: alpha/beta fold hydrolase [Candidatus Krumholzibacteria bacterium]|nr:alpha/beta fold hydrolase [Candidatus Krumholzibacteria bacterium]HRX49836.1 alpha/beta fold hydrolase [Candidatus Krumholzibacteria bacterium]